MDSGMVRPPIDVDNKPSHPRRGSLQKPIYSKVPDTRAEEVEAIFDRNQNPQSVRRRACQWGGSRLVCYYGDHRYRDRQQQ